MRLDWSRVQKQQQIFDNTCTCVYSPSVATATALELTTVAVIPGTGRKKGLCCFKIAVHCDFSHSTPTHRAGNTAGLQQLHPPILSASTLPSAFCRNQNSRIHIHIYRSNPSASLYQLCFFATYQLVYCLIFFFPQEIIRLGGQHSHGYCSWLSLWKEIQIPRGKVSQSG